MVTQDKSLQMAGQGAYRPESRRRDGQAAGEGVGSRQRQESLAQPEGSGPPVRKHSGRPQGPGTQASAPQGEAGAGRVSPQEANSLRERIPIHGTSN